MHSLFNTWKKKGKFKDFTTQTSKFRCTYYLSRKLLKYPTSFEYKIQTKIKYGITGKKQNETKQVKYHVRNSAVLIHKEILDNQPTYH
jgi:hypothetical protein